MITHKVRRTTVRDLGNPAGGEFPWCRSLDGQTISLEKVSYSDQFIFLSIRAQSTRQPVDTFDPNRKLSAHHVQGLANGFAALPRFFLHNALFPACGEIVRIVEG